MKTLIKTNKNVIRFWAIGDLIITGLLVFPPVATRFLELLLGINAWFGGQTGPQALSQFGLLFVCIAGTLGVVWAVARLIRPTWWLAMVDAVARLWVGVLIAYFVFVRGVPGILLLFVLSEWAGGIHQGVRLIFTRDGSAQPPPDQQPPQYPPAEDQRVTP